jgi:hypothetical protein
MTITVACAHHVSLQSISVMLRQAWRRGVERGEVEVTRTFTICQPERTTLSGHYEVAFGHEAAL